MPLKHPAALETVDAQVRMFALYVGQGMLFTRVELARRTGIPEATLQGWAGGAAMPVWAVNVLADHLPGEAINLLFSPSGRKITLIDPNAADWDDLASSVSKMTFEICDARSDGAIDHVEEARLRRSASALYAHLGSVVEGMKP